MIEVTPSGVLLFARGEVNNFRQAIVKFSSLDNVVPAREVGNRALATFAEEFLPHQPYLEWTEFERQPEGKVFALAGNFVVFSAIVEQERYAMAVTSAIAQPPT